MDEHILDVASAVKSFSYVSYESTPKHGQLTIAVSASNTNNHSPIPLLNVLCSGGLPRLESLHLGSFGKLFGVALDCMDIIPHSLPNLRSLHIGFQAYTAILAALFAAAGPTLTTLKIETGASSRAAVHLLARYGYPWLDSLTDFSVEWPPGYQQPAFAWGPDTPQHLAAALARLPALKTLAVTCPAYEELVVRLLALAESGGLAQLTTLNLRSYNYCGDVSTSMSHGARALLLLWLKREAKKALMGEEPAAVWNVWGLMDSKMPEYMKQVTVNALAQIKEAHARL